MSKVTVAKDQAEELYTIVRRSPVAQVPGAMETMRKCVRRSAKIYYGEVNGQVACVWGLIPPTILSDSAYLWLLTTDIVAENKFLFVRHSQRYVEEMLKEFPLIIGDCMLDNPQAVRWLRWLGAHFHDPVDGRLPFSIRATNG